MFDLAGEGLLCPQSNLFCGFVYQCIVFCFVNSHRFLLHLSSIAPKVFTDRTGLSKQLDTIRYRLDCAIRHDNMPMQCIPLTPHYHKVKLEFKGYTFFLSFTLKYRLWVPIRGGCNMYPRTMFLAKKKKKEKKKSTFFF